MYLARFVFTISSLKFVVMLCVGRVRWAVTSGLNCCCVFEGSHNRSIYPCAEPSENRSRGAAFFFRGEIVNQTGRRLEGYNAANKQVSATSV